MTSLKINTNPQVVTKFDSYPPKVKTKLERLRKLILETALETEGITEIEETLKWGEPSFLAKKGSTLRLDWKEKTPDQYAMYFKCTSKLVETFKIVYGDTFNYEKTRAIIFELDDKVSTKKLKKCIGAALQYHQIKSLPKLGL